MSTARGTSQKQPERWGTLGSQSVVSRDPGSRVEESFLGASDLQGVLGSQHQRNGRSYFREPWGKEPIQGLRIYRCHWERAGREGEFGNAVKGENCSCVIPGEVGVDGNWSIGGGTFSDLLVRFFVYPVNLLVFHVLPFSQWNGWQ